MHTEIRRNLEQHLQTLCLRIGSRHIGSPGEAAAADYIAAEFSRYGYAPRRETYPVTGWTSSAFELLNLTRGRAVPTAVPCFFSSPVCAEGELLWIRSRDITRLAELPVRGRICMVEFWNSMEKVFGRNAIAEELDALGASAAIFISNYHTSLAASSKIQRSPFLQRLATVAVAEEGAFDIARHKHDIYRLVIAAQTFPHESANVIAALPGAKPGRGVLGAHYDTAPGTQGAGDNASGTAMLLEMARLLRHETGGLSLDFAAFSAEEYIPVDLPPGSGDYIKRHRDQDLRWYFNFDDCGLLLADTQIRIGYPEKLPPLQPVAYPFGPAFQGGDDKSFHQAGIPTIWYYDDNPFKVLHTERDRIEMLDLDRMTDALIDAVQLFHQLNSEVKRP